MLKGVQEAAGGGGVDGCQFNYGIRDPLDSPVRPHHFVIDGHGQKERAAPGGLSDIESGPFFFALDHVKNIFPSTAGHDSEVIGITAEVSVPCFKDFLENGSPLGAGTAVERRQRGHAIVGRRGAAVMVENDPVALRRIVDGDQIQEDMLEETVFDAVFGRATGGQGIGVQPFKLLDKSFR